MANTGYAHHVYIAKKIMTHKTGECPLILVQLGLECFSPVMVVKGSYGGKDKQKRWIKFWNSIKINPGKLQDLNLA